MKFYQRPKKTREFSGRVEVAIFPIDKTGVRMSRGDGVERKSFRLEDTTVGEVYQVLCEAISKRVDAKK